MNCIGGISGDILIGALIDCGIDVDILNQALASLKVEDICINGIADERRGVTGTYATVSVPETNERRNIRDFIRIIQNSDLSDEVIATATTVFESLGKAEATVHRKSVENTHLHELGDLDTLVDVVGGVVGLSHLGITSLYCSPLPTGSGFVRSEHGLLPVPSPATAVLMEMAGVPVVPPPQNLVDAGEMVTPTGAAMVTTLATFEQPPMKVENIGYGLGTKDPSSYPNVAALWIGRELDAKPVTGLNLIETNIDDMSAEVMAYVQERLMDAGARDVWFTPIQMKKNRPATMISVLVSDDMESTAVDMLMRETSTFGVRVRPVTRYEADRELVEIQTSLGVVSVKVKRLRQTNVSIHPEYEDCRRIGIELGIPFQDVYNVVHSEASAKLLG